MGLGAERITPAEPGVADISYKMAEGLGNHRFTLNFDSKKYASLFLKEDLDEEVISGIEVNFASGDKSVAAGTVSFSGKKIDIWPNLFYNGYKKFIGTAAAFADEKKGEDNLRKTGFFRILYTDRLVDYLNKAPVERSRPFIKKLAKRVLDRELDNTMIHEAEHVIDNNKNKLVIYSSIALKILNWVGTSLPIWYISNDFSLSTDLGSPVSYVKFIVSLGLGFVPAALFYPISLYHIDPMEVRARKFADRMIKRSEYRGILSIDPV